MDLSRMTSTEGGVICCGVAAIFGLMGIGHELDAEYLKSVTRVNQLTDLDQLLNAPNRALRLVVAVSGRVASDTPIKCKYSNLECVAVEKKETHHFLKRDDKGVWKEKKIEFSPERKAVPWYLDDGSNTRLHVQLGTHSLPLKFGGRLFKKCEQTPDLEELAEGGVKMVGIEEIEDVLPIGRNVTVVGEAFKDSTGKFFMRRKYGVRDFFISYRTLDQLIASSKSASSLAMGFSLGFAAMGVGLFASDAIKYTMKIWSE